MGLLDDNGQELETKLAGESVSKPGTRVLLADNAETTFIFEDVASPPIPSLFRGFSAPIKLSGISPERSRFLAAHDTDPFVRWDSGQQYATRVLLDLIPVWNRGDSVADRSRPDRGGVRKPWPNREQRPGVRRRGTFIYQVRRSSRIRWRSPMSTRSTRCAMPRGRRSARRCTTGCEATYETCYTDTGPYSIDGRGDRQAVAAKCLPVVFKRGPGDPVAGMNAAIRHRLAQHDGLAGRAVGAGGRRLSGARRGPDAAFRTRNGTAIHLCWTSGFQSRRHRPLPDTVSLCARLCPRTRISTCAILIASVHWSGHSRAPTRCGSMIRKAAGYRFLADIVIQLDPSNPQIAARMVGTLGQWRRMDTSRQALMKAELERILALPGDLSTNTFSVRMVSKAGLMPHRR